MTIDVTTTSKLKQLFFFQTECDEQVTSLKVNSTAKRRFSLLKDFGIRKKEPEDESDKNRRASVMLKFRHSRQNSQENNDAFDGPKR